MKSRGQDEVDDCDAPKQNSCEQCEKQRSGNRAHLDERLYAVQPLPINLARSHGYSTYYD